MRKTVPGVVLVAASLLSFSSGALDKSAPFGFSWGPVDTVPAPSLASRESNITPLTYYRDRLPPNELRDTEKIVLEVCKTEGLQQIVWISRILSASEEHDKIKSILAEGTRRYGKAAITERGIIQWNAGRTMTTTIPNRQGLRRVVMVSTGPGFETCSEEHKSITGHTLDNYWMNFVPNAEMN